MYDRKHILHLYTKIANQRTLSDEDAKLIADYNRALQMVRSRTVSCWPEIAISFGHKFGVK